MDTNTPTESIWKKSWKGPRGILSWFVALTVIAFVLILLVHFVEVEGGSSKAHPLGRVIVFAWLYAMCYALAGLLIVGFVRWICSWRNFRRFLFGVACFITLIAIFYAEENWRGKRAWDNYRREWEAKGERFSSSALAPASVPDDRNFALTPLLKPALDFTRTPQGIVWHDTNAYAHLQNVRAELISKRSANQELVLGNLDKGTFADLEAYRSFYLGNTNYPQPVKPGTAAQDVLVALGKFDPELNELREAAASRPDSRFPVEYDYEMPAAILLPHLSQVKGLVALTQVHALALLEAGRSNEAFADLKLGLRLSDSVRDEPILISHLVRIATLSMILQTVREGLIRHAWSDAQLAELEKSLASVNLITGLNIAMRGERALGVGCVEWARRQGFKFRPEEFMDSSGGNSPAMIQSLRFMPSGWYYQNALTIARLHEAYTLRVADEQMHSVSPEIATASDDAVNALGKSNPFGVFARLLFPALNNCIIKSARTQTYVDAARIACVLERFRLASGKLPDALVALTPQFIDSLPTDVIDGQPLRYRLMSGGGYIIYSVGWNKTDDGGELAFKSEKNVNVDSAKGDWVWQMPAK